MNKNTFTFTRIQLAWLAFRIIISGGSTYAVIKPEEIADYSPADIPYMGDNTYQDIAKVLADEGTIRYFAEFDERNPRFHRPIYNTEYQDIQEWPRNLTATFTDFCADPELGNPIEVVATPDGFRSTGIYGGDKWLYVAYKERRKILVKICSVDLS